MAASGVWQPVSWIRWRRWTSRPSVTAFTMNLVCSGRRSSRAAKSRWPMLGWRTTTLGSSVGLICASASRSTVACSRMSMTAAITAPNSSIRVTSSACPGISRLRASPPAALTPSDFGNPRRPTNSTSAPSTAGVTWKPSVIATPAKQSPRSSIRTIAPKAVRSSVWCSRSSSCRAHSRTSCVGTAV